MRRIVFVMLLATSVIALAAGTSSQSGFGDNEVALKASLPGGKVFTVHITRTVWSETSCRGAQLWGSYGRKPALVVSSFLAKSNGDDILVPFSAFSDLAEPSTVALRSSGRDVDVEISGGEGGDSYTAIITFENGSHIVRRRVASRVMPKDAFEETKYKHVQD